jgi:hypothetical protein
VDERCKDFDRKEKKLGKQDGEKRDGKRNEMGTKIDARKKERAFKALPKKDTRQRT